MSYCASNRWTNLKSMEDASYFNDNMPQIGGMNLQLVEGASNLCDIPPRFGGRILALVEKPK